MSTHADGLDELRAALRADAAGVAEALLGAPNKAASTRHTLRWGSKGSLALEVHGPKRGLWFTHEGAEGSDLLGLIRHVRGCDFPDALKWASNRTGITIEGTANDDAQSEQRWAQQDVDRRARQAEADARREAEEDAERRSGIAWVQRIAKQTVPADGTLADWYLRQARGIPRPAAGWPDAVRWHCGYHALVVVATRVDGTAQRIQRVHLGASGEKLSAEEVERRGLPAVKLTNGPQTGAVVRLPGDPAAPLLLAEGPETGLACWSSTGFETWIALGGIGGVEVPMGRRVVAISDDNPLARDAKLGSAARVLNKAAAAWRKAGVDLVIATPWEARRRDKSDMADLILAHGPDAVRRRIQMALQPRSATVERLPLADAERAVTEAVGAFFARVDRLSAAQVALDQKAAAAIQGCLPVDDGSAPEFALPSGAESAQPTMFTHGVRVTVGVGKSHAARDGVGRTLAAMRARGDTRNMVIAIPEHALGDEQAAAWQALPSVQAAGLRVATWRGRGAPNPADPSYADLNVPKSDKIKMCGDLERVSDVHAVGLSAQTAACKTTLKDDDGKRHTVTCPLFDTCAYQAQTKVKADLWLVAHSSLFHSKPVALGEIVAVIVDEEAWRTGLVGAEGRHITLTVDALASGSTGALSGVSRDRLLDLRRQLVATLNAMPDGPVQRDALKPVRLTASSAAEGRALEWERKLETKAIHPGLTREERRTAMEALDANRTVARCAMVWDALAALLVDNGPKASGWLALDVEPTRDGPARVLRLKGRSDLASGWKAPTLLLDALLPVELVRYYWPDVQLVADVQAVMPHQHISQVTDKAYALSMLGPLGKEAAAANPKEAQRRLNRLRDLRAVLVREAVRRAPGQVLVVAQKAVKEALIELGGLPSNLALAHHNAIAGRDEWRNAAAVIIVGRTLPSPAVVERIAEALTGEAVPALVGWYDRCDAVREMADGSAVQADADRHPHPVAEMVRWQIAEGQLVQIAGRGRGVRRTEANPVHILALVDTPLPLPLAGTLDAADVEPGSSDMMLAEGGVVLENARHAFAAYPSLWPSHGAAAKAIEKGRSRNFPYYRISLGEIPTPRQIEGGLAEVAYQAAGAGQKPVKAWADLLLCPDPATFLTARLGKLAWCKVGGLPPPDPDPPAASIDDEAVQDEAGAFTPDLVPDAPWLHPSVPAHAEPNGQTVLARCPFCDEQHRHHGFGRRWAHCVNPGARRYELIDAGPVLPPLTRGATAGLPGYGAYGAGAGATGATGPGP